MASVEMRSRRAPSSKKAKPERSRVKPRGPPRLQSTKLLPQDSSFTRGSMPSSMEEAGDKKELKESMTSLPSLDEEDKGSLQVNDESPYSSRATSREERSLEGEGDGESDDMTSRFRVISPSRINSRWSDTSSYGVKKVSLSFFFWLKITPS
ncbi:putative myosin-1 [Cocos nucifera]|nr:putative myosin-1 [Cocos nucifera]